MKLRSLGYQTDLMLSRFDGEVLERESYLAVCTPTNPTYWWGNFLLFAQPPRDGQLDEWLEIFRQEFHAIDGIAHVSLAWDVGHGPGVVEPFVADGFSLVENIFLFAKDVKRPPGCNTDVTVRLIASDDDWAQVWTNHQACISNTEEEPESFKRFLEGQLRRYRRMVSAGLGNWFGAFLGERLVADMGLFAEGGLARCQSVGTAPEYRRQGICGRLVYEVCRYGFQQMHAETVVILAEQGASAAKIYESVGCVPTESTQSLSRRGSIF